MINGYKEAQIVNEILNNDLGLAQASNADELQRALRYDVLATMNYLRTIKIHCELLMEMTMQDREPK